MKYEVTEELIKSVIETLKGIDVRGYDSMDRLVGLVMLFERILNMPAPTTEEEDGEE